MHEYSLYLGCIIPARFPFMEKSLRMTFSALDIETQDLEGTTCCPTKTIIRPMGEYQWCLTAARNLSIAEKTGLDLLIPCNGCYSTFKTVQHMLSTNSNLRERINNSLSKVGLKYQGNIEIKHLIEVLHDDIGIQVVRGKITRPLEGMKIAAHPGCHMVRPSLGINFDDPNNPKKFDALIETLGARSIDYRTKMLCCGGAFLNSDEPENANALSREKLLEVQNLADAIALVCPSCFMQYDSRQYTMKKEGEKINLPIIYYPELLGLAMGFSQEEMGMHMHRIETRAFLEKWHLMQEYFKALREHFDLASLRRCYECAACLDDCPSAKVSPFNPNQMIGSLLEGKLEEALDSPEIWRCLDCYTCYELCPQKFGMNKVFDRLKSLALKKGKAPKTMGATIEMFKKTGSLGEPTMLRKKLKLPEAPESGGEELKKLLEGEKQ